MKVLVFHPALAPYRVDFFNALNNYFEASFYFSLKNVNDQKFDQENLKSLCNFNCNYISRCCTLENSQCCIPVTHCMGLFRNLSIFKCTGRV